jgi:hypothetical protein
MTTHIFSKYQVPNRTAIFTNIPIDQLATFKNMFNCSKLKYTIKYRGPRKNDGRAKSTQQANCLKSFARAFSVYQN